MSLRRHPGEPAIYPSNMLQPFPPPILPIYAISAVVQDVRGTLIANCPNAAMADFVAWSINVNNGIHGL